MTPADRCVYRRPFRSDFTGCPAFQPLDFQPTDTLHRPMRAGTTCQHLSTGDLGTGHHYPCCRLGSAEQREEWVRTVRSERLDAVRAILVAESEAIQPVLNEMRRIKAEAVQDGGRWIPSPALLAAAAAVVRESEAFLDSRAAELHRLGLPVEACKALSRSVIDQYLARSTELTDWKISDEILEMFPAEVRPLIRPD